MPLTIQPSIWPYNFLRRYTVFDDFTSETAATAGYPFQESNSGTGAAVTAQVIDTANRPGVAGVALGTTTTGRSSLFTVPTSTAMGAGISIYRAAIIIPTLSDGVETYSFWFGWFDTVTAGAQTDAAMFLYDTAGAATGSAASANWQLVTAAAAARTYTTTGTAVAAATWLRLRVEVNAAASSVGFYLNDALLGTHVANIPTGVAQAVGAGVAGIKSAGTTSRQVNLDYMMADIVFTTPRM